MRLDSREFIEGDYEKFICSITKDHMKDLFIKNFGGWSDEVSRNKFFEILESGFVRLFFLNDEFVGYVTFSLERDFKDSFMINDIHVVDKFQGRGFGREIIEFVIDKVVGLSGNQVRLFVFGNNSSIKFYEKCGFLKVDFWEKSNTCVMVRSV